MNAKNVLKESSVSAKGELSLPVCKKMVSGHRQCSFIGQTNSVLCDFGELDSNVRYRLFRSYCSSNYGCEL